LLDAKENRDTTHKVEITNVLDKMRGVIDVTDADVKDLNEDDV